jgi:hypothetical protein
VVWRSSSPTKPARSGSAVNAGSGIATEIERSRGPAVRDGSASGRAHSRAADSRRESQQ